MYRTRRNLVAAALLAPAQLTTFAAPVDRPSDRLPREVRRELVMLPLYGIFDYLEYRIDGRTVTLLGQVTRPSLKNEATQRVKAIEGVERVMDEIELLPLSTNDDRIRSQVYRAVYGSPSLTRYAWYAVSSIHILVKNGNVTLVGAVGTEGDRTLAGIEAGQVPGVFALKNELRVDRRL